MHLRERLQLVRGVGVLGEGQGRVAGVREKEKKKGGGYCRWVKGGGVKEKKVVWRGE